MGFSFKIDLFPLKTQSRSLLLFSVIFRKLNQLRFTTINSIINWWTSFKLINKFRSDNILLFIYLNKTCIKIGCLHTEERVYSRPFITYFFCAQFCVCFFFLRTRIQSFVCLCGQWSMSENCIRNKFTDHSQCHYQTC